jgi:hypothetical protein
MPIDIMAKRIDSAYTSGSRIPDWLTFFGALVLAVREDGAWHYIGHVGTGFKFLEDLHAKLVKLKAPKSPFAAKVKDEVATIWVRPSLVAEVKFASGRARANSVSPSTSDLGPTNARRMSCANENVRVSSDPFVPVRSVASKVVDFRSHALRCNFERRKRDRQPEAPPSRAAGIQVENAADRVDLRYVGMPGNDHIDAGAGIDLQRLQVVQNVDRLSRQAHEFGAGVFPGPVAAVDVSTDGGDGRDPAKRVDDLGMPDVAGVNDVIDARQASFRLGPQQAVRIRNDSNTEHHFPALSPTIAKDDREAPFVRTASSFVQTRYRTIRRGRLRESSPTASGGHSISNVLLVSAAGSKWPSPANATTSFPPRWRT